VVAAYSSWVMPFLSFRSAPAQKALSLFEAMMSALVPPTPPSSLICCTCRLKSATSLFDKAFLFAGRSSSKTRTPPECGAGWCCTRIGEGSTDSHRFCVETCCRPGRIDCLSRRRMVNVVCLGFSKLIARRQFGQSSSAHLRRE
jgi:hypothetical protein